MKFASSFTGFDGVGIGAQAEGCDLLWGVEIDAAIADIANRNLGDHVKVADILDCNPADFERPDIFHASPVCTRASNANANAQESELDIAMARKTAEFVRVLQPAVFTLENVWGYRSFTSFLVILEALKECGYLYNFWHLNAADYGVAQTRKRLILIARKDRKPQRPEPTHYDPKRDGPMSALFGLRPWVGWYEAIEDLLPGLPDSQFAPWQIEKMGEPYRSFILGQMTRSEARAGDEPAETITAGNNQAGIKAFLVDGINARNFGNDITVLSEDDPCNTITSSINKGLHRGYANGRVVRLSTRCLARLQSFPDWYELPAKTTLACKGIGNAVPPLLYQRIIESLGSI